ncbi:hypothetical protein [Actinoplanes flavus]|uniref:Uncharacterized protein n=1 Tax=Actinoplanes flavus TaxID=2820290 RepID=A0ABS3UM20_9ACTN|nr:hypothetical protein [Actinoplanes flavus]MBO3738707.1 hypothetical protein [Actinoplanes flavus]
MTPTSSFDESAGGAGRHRERAAALAELARTRSRNGDHEGAVIAASELFVLHRAAGDEAGLALVLNDLAGYMAGVGRLTEAVEFATEAVARFRRLGDPDGLATALRTLEQRRAAVDDPARDLPGEHLDFIDGWLAAPDWPGQAAVLARHHRLLGDPGLRRTVAAVAAARGGEPLDVLRMLVDDMGARGVDVVLADLERSIEEQDAIAAWTAAPSWPESVDHLREHTAILTRPSVQAVLMRSSDPRDRLHATVLRLAARFPLDTVLRILTEPPVTAELALRAVEEGDLALVVDLIPACRAVLDLPGDGPFLWAVMLFSAGRVAEGTAAARTAAEAMTGVQVRANRARLRRMLAAPLPPACRTGIEGFLTLLGP